MADVRMGELLQSIFRFARFRSAGSHPHDAWWESCWGGGRAEMKRFCPRMLKCEELPINCNAAW
jgi:hypothetical protein